MEISAQALVEKLRPIKLVIFDVDGVLTDGRIIYDNAGVETKAFDVKDGHGIKLLMRCGIDVGIITARESNVVAVRAANLGIGIVFQGMKDKLKAFEEILRTTGLAPSQIGYVGDDIIDLPVIRRAGFSASVADGVSEVRERVDYIAQKKGGCGAAREICELVLKAQGHWDAVIAGYLR